MLYIAVWLVSWSVSRTPSFIIPAVALVLHMYRVAGAVALWFTVLYKLNGTYNRQGFYIDEIQISTQKAPSAQAGRDGI